MAAAPLIIAGIGAISSIAAGVMSMKSAGAAQAGIQSAQNAAELDAMTQEGDRRDRLKEALAGQEVAYAANGISLNSASLSVLQSADKERAAKDIGLIRAGLANWGQQAKLESKSYALKGKTAMISSVVDAGSRLYGGYSDYVDVQKGTN